MAAGVAAPVVTGRAVIVMSPADRVQVITSHPKSFTGGGTRLTVPIGAVVSGVGEKVMAAGFSGGATQGEVPKPDAYAVAIRLLDFSYKYDSLSTAGFTVTPRVTISLQAAVTAPGASQPLFNQRYERTDYSQGDYVVSLHPGEKVNQALHMALGDIYRSILDDIAKAATQPAPARRSLTPA